ncbi:hypothetical protein [Micromonospora sp. NPDC005305]|uniref:hypothetical protein n=1 Tax=Micromonospora sp. NPDC005305 TaxID=3156875 RepID=UPI0033B61C48
MLPIALTCPVWWVARWTARTLATLAVLVACSFGAATLPLGGAATAPVAPTVVASVEGPPPQAGAAAGQHLRAAVDRTIAGAATEQDRTSGTTATTAGPEFTGGVAAIAGAGQGFALVLTGLVPATVGSRAPPVR